MSSHCFVGYFLTVKPAISDRCNLGSCGGKSVYVIELKFEHPVNRSSQCLGKNSFIRSQVMIRFTVQFVANFVIGCRDKEGKLTDCI